MLWLNIKIIFIIEQGEEEIWDEKNALLAKERLLEIISKTSKNWEEKSEDVKVNGFVQE